MGYCETQCWPATVLWAGRELGGFQTGTNLVPFLPLNNWMFQGNPISFCLSYQCLPVKEACAVEVLCCYCPKLCERYCWYWINNKNWMMLIRACYMEIKPLVVGTEPCCCVHNGGPYLLLFTERRSHFSVCYLSLLLWEVDVGRRM